jgi:DtxR family Mn-dependent transcriptional regulator
MPQPLLYLTIAGLIAIAGLLAFWPRRGLLARWQRARQATEHVLTEDALKHIHACEMRGQAATTASVAGVLQITDDRSAALLGNMAAANLLLADQGGVRLTPQGREAALHIIRAHRLWERYLADETGYAAEEWHEQAERHEHALAPTDLELLSARLGNPLNDPHGDPIPDAAGDFVAPEGLPLSAAPLDQPVRIVHIEDEPATIYAQLVAEGLYPGQVIRVIEAEPQRVRFWSNGNEHVLAPLLAANIAVTPAPSPARRFDDARLAAAETLASLAIGQKGKVAGISPRCRGAERRRLMDLGVLPGAIIAAEMISPSGDPTAYSIRGATIALRREQARLIHITRQTEATA